MTTGPPPHDECPNSADVGSYLLGALPDAEHAAFSAHLADCADCRNEMTELRVTTDTLPLAAVPHQPPADLKDRIMAVVRSEAQLLRAAGPDAKRVKPGRSRVWRPAPSVRRLTAAGAAFTLLAIAAIAGIELKTKESKGTRTVAARVLLRSATARLDITDGRGRLIMTGLPRPPAGHVYQVWLQRSGRAPQPSGAFYDVARRGATSEEVHGSLRDVRHVLVTIEPKPGSAAPTSAPVIDATLY